MSDSNQILSKQERLQRMREAKRQRDDVKKKKMDQLDIGIQPGKTHIDHEIIDRILRDEDPFAPDELKKEGAEAGEVLKEDLKISTFVVDLQIPAPEKPITYERNVQCSIIDSTMIKHMQTIKEEQEHEEEGQQNLSDMQGNPIYSPFSGSSPDHLRRKTRGKNSVKGSFIGGSFIEGDAPPIPETEEEKTKREKKELMESFQLMTKEDSLLEMQKRGFEEFLTKSSRIIERALDQEFDVVGDFFEESDDEGAAGKKQKGDKITQQFIFQQNLHMKRAVTSMDWSPKEAELLLVSYSKCSEFRYDEPDGLVNIFSLSLKNRPEHTLTCQNEVTKAMFNPFQPNVVIGATQSGYIVQWDIRVKSTPIQKSIVAKDGHSHPIYSLAIVGTKNAHNIVSISNDSKICQWHFGELNNPKINFNMFNQAIGSSNAQNNEQTLVRVNTMEFPEEESDKFYVGAEDYNIYQANLHMSSAKEPQNWLVYQGHQAPVTKIALHPGKSMTEGKSGAKTMMADMSELMLSASMDWTVKLWYAKNEEKRTPIFTFESSQEYVYDVQWSPVHPSIFAQVDGDGFVDIWDIHKDHESPIAHKKAFESAGGAGAYKDFDDSKALSCLKWSRDGRRIAIGDSDGFVSIWQTDKELYMPNQNDFDFIEDLIKNNSPENQQ